MSAAELEALSEAARTAEAASRVRPEDQVLADRAHEARCEYEAARKKVLQEDPNERG